MLKETAALVRRPENVSISLPDSSTARNAVKLATMRFMFGEVGESKLPLNQSQAHCYILIES